MCYRYKNIVLRLQENTGFLAEYKKTISCQDLEIERLRLEKRNMEYELRTLYKAVLKSGLSLDAPKSSFDIPTDAARRISLPVTSLTLSPYIRNCLQKLELHTMEDLLRYARKKGLGSLLKISGFGWRENKIRYCYFICLIISAGIWGKGILIFIIHLYILFSVVEALIKITTSNR